MQPLSGSSPRYSRWPRLICVLTFVCLGLAVAPPALATTHVAGGTHISSNTTWTTADGPYILDGSAYVNSGVTLTIDAGVTVKLAGGHYSQFTINGTLTASGSSGSHVTITSGQATPAAGDWYDVLINGSATLDYTDVYYGGYGFADYTQGSVLVGDDGSATLDHAVIQYSMTSGLLVGLGGTSSPFASATVTHSTFSSNDDGIYASNGYLSLTASNQVSSNARDGVALSYTTAYTGTASDVSNNTITSNSRYGVYYVPTSGFVGTAYEPTGHENNIYGNSNYQYYGTQQESTLDWTNNYWGATMYTYTNPVYCLTFYPTAYYHIQSTSTSPGSGPAAGPVYWEEHDFWVNNVQIRCAVDSTLAVSYSNSSF